MKELVVCRCRHVNFDHTGEDEKGPCLALNYPRLRFFGRGIVVCRCDGFVPMSWDEYAETAGNYRMGTPALRTDA